MAVEQEENSRSNDYLVVNLAGQKFGIPVLQVQDVLREQKVTRIPLAPPEVAGSLNLRGRIVTAIDVRRRLGLEPREKNASCMSVVVELHNELFSLIIDSVGDVLSFNKQKFERNPGTLDVAWRDISKGIFQLEKELLIVMDVSKLIDDIVKTD